MGTEAYSNPAATKVDAALVAELRKKTGVGIAKCREALVAEGGDLAKAEERLRVQGWKPGQDRPTGEGLVAIATSEDGRAAALVELRCETDFAARSDRFSALAKGLAAAALAGSLEAEAGRRIPEEAAVIKETLVLGHAERVAAPDGKVGTYVHTNGKLGALAVVKADQAALAKPGADQVLKDLAMHVAGAVPPPVAVSREAIPPELVETERRIILKQLEGDKRPDAIKEKIVCGKLGRFYSERALLEQPFVRDPEKTVGRWLEERSAELGGKVEVVSLHRRQLGGGQ